MVAGSLDKENGASARRGKKREFYIISHPSTTASFQGSPSPVTNKEIPCVRNQSDAIRQRHILGETVLSREIEALHNTVDYGLIDDPQ